MQNPDQKVEQLEGVGPSVYAHVDAETLAILDQFSDAKVMPRSWLISNILREWAESKAEQQNPTLAA